MLCLTTMSPAAGLGARPFGGWIKRSPARLCALRPQLAACAGRQQAGASTGAAGGAATLPAYLSGLAAANWAAPAAAQEAAEGAGAAAVADAAAAAEQAAAAAGQLSAAGPAPDDPVISVLFTFALAALTIMTLGVSAKRWSCAAVQRLAAGGAAQ